MGAPHAGNDLVRGEPSPQKRGPVPAQTLPPMVRREAAVR